jgi:hypothetical protein
MAMQPKQMEDTVSIANRISSDRKRTNLLKGIEQPTLIFLCRVLPAWLSPNLLTFVGFIGSLIVFTGFYFARQNVYYLSVSIIGLAIQWFGDSLDGRIAYYRNITRKWYGFALDMSMDWVSTVLMAAGFHIYMAEPYKMIAIAFMAGYAWGMMMALIRYKITDVYAIDFGLIGPTEIRIIISLILIITILQPQSLVIMATAVVAVIFMVNINDFLKLLKSGNEKDRQEKL